MSLAITRLPPYEGVTLAQGLNNLEISKERRYTLDLNKLAEFDHWRPRYPSQNAAMGESANAHAQRLIDSKYLSIIPGAAVAWRWCHLLALRFLPMPRAQSRQNLICGTSAVNGQMANIESAVAMFVYQFRRPLSLEVTAPCVPNTHFGIRIRYRICDKHSRESHTEYFDPYSASQGDCSDYPVFFEKLVRKFGGDSQGRLFDAL